MKLKWWKIYAQERHELLIKGLDNLLDAGHAFDLSRTLSAGGAVIFPHCYLRACGDYVAAAVHAVLDSGVDQILCLGVLHLTRERRVHGAQVTPQRTALHPLRGVYGPDATTLRRYSREYCLEGFEFLLQQECKRRGRTPPLIFKRYPFGVGEEPESLPGIDGLIALSRNAAILATVDFVHHGVAYGDKEPCPICEDVRVLAVSNVERNLQLLMEGPGDSFRAHGEEIGSDGLDVLRVLHFLVRPLVASLVDLRLVDVSQAFADLPAPSWVAGALASCSAV